MLLTFQYARLTSPSPYLPSQLPYLYSALHPSHHRISSTLVIHTTSHLLPIAQRCEYGADSLNRAPQSQEIAHTSETSTPPPHHSPTPRNASQSTTPRLHCRPKREERLAWSSNPGDRLSSAPPPPSSLPLLRQNPLTTHRIRRPLHRTQTRRRS